MRVDRAVITSPFAGAVRTARSSSTRWTSSLFLIALGEPTGLHVPESDYAQVRTLGGCTAYLAARLDVTKE